ncbi:hypothetical protein ACRAWF_07770 [Streptomyces sp. L7]
MLDQIVGPVETMLKETGGYGGDAEVEVGVPARGQVPPQCLPAEREAMLSRFARAARAAPTGMDGEAGARFEERVQLSGGDVRPAARSLDQDGQGVAGPGVARCSS